MNQQNKIIELESELKKLKTQLSLAHIEIACQKRLHIACEEFVKQNQDKLNELRENPAFKTTHDLVNFYEQKLHKYKTVLTEISNYNQNNNKSCWEVVTEIKNIASSVINPS